MLSGASFTEQTTLCLDADLIEWFKAHHSEDEGCQTIINRVLRKYVSQKAVQVE